MLTLTFEFLERPDEMDRVTLVATVKKLEDGRLTECKTSGPSAEILQREVLRWHQRTAASGNGSPERAA